MKWNLESYTLTLSSVEILLCILRKNTDSDNYSSLTRANSSLEILVGSWVPGRYVEVLK